MKSYRLFNTLVLLSVGLSSSFAQCDSIILINQQEINQFIQKYGRCKEVNHLIIKDKSSDISQFDSLYTIERVNGRLSFEFSKSNENLKNIVGFRNLRYVDELMGNTYIFNGQFTQLDTINNLTFTSEDHVDRPSYFSYFPKLKHIENHLTIKGYITEVTTPKFTTGSNFHLSLNGYIDSTTLKILSSRIKKENLKSFSVFPGNNINLKYLSILDSVENLHFAYCENSNFSNISTIRKLRNFTLESDLGNNDYGDGLKHIEDLGFVLFQNNKYILDYKAILPNLKSINRVLTIYIHDLITNLHFLDNVSPPLEKAKHSFATIFIQYNKSLANCNTSFLCEALAKYPESVIISGNAGKCTKEEILKYCSTVNTIEQQKQYLKLSPNPTYGYLKVDNVDSPATITITNLFGQVCKTLHNIQNEVNISDLAPGIYIFDIKNKSVSERHKIVKVN